MSGPIYNHVGKKYRNGQGAYLTRSLFKEFGNEDAPYTFDMLREAYLNFYDPTEYKFAVEYFEDWAHFEHMLTISWFKKERDKWQRELEVKVRAEGLNAVVDQVRDNGNFQAAKFLVTKGWVDSPEPVKAKRGRPTKEEVMGAIKQEAGLDEATEDDLKRILN